MPATVDRPPNPADRLKLAIKIRKQIAQLERKLGMLSRNMPKYVLVRNEYGLSAVEMKKIAQNLHAKAKEGIARGRSKEFRGSIEEAL
jgi:hypothetical protein